MQIVHPLLAVSLFLSLSFFHSLPFFFFFLSLAVWLPVLFQEIVGNKETTLGSLTNPLILTLDLYSYVHKEEKLVFLFFMHQDNEAVWPPLNAFI